AEDGIRDFHVTGVQTCALPILLSLDVLRRLDAELGLRAHYSGQGDWFSRLWDAKTPMELFQDYFKSRVEIEVDEFAGVLVIRAQIGRASCRERVKSSVGAGAVQ